jgi:ssDNA thymidine ADP-ribosyltransferase, DarT
LENLEWDVINMMRPIEFEESKRIRSAEVLVPDSLALTKVQCIAVNTEKMMQIVRTMATEYGFSEFAPFISLDPSLFL